MKKYLADFFSIVFLLSFSAQAQNLVPNPSFEQHDTCPNNISQINMATGWNPVYPTPDYFNACSTDTLFNGQIIVGVPSNYCGYRTAASGIAYSGIIAKGGSSEGSEIIGTQLLSPLQIGVRYYISFKVSLAGHANPNQYCGINKLGVLFSNVIYNNLSNPIVCNCAQIYSDSIIIDTLEWTRVTGSFVADSNYSSVNIGRFFSNTTTDSIQIAGSICFAYYFIDDICVSTDSAYSYNYIYTGIENGVSHNNSIKCYPNPFRDFLIVENPEESIDMVKVYNSLGQEIKTFQAYSPYKNVFDLSSLTKGAYYLELIQSNQKVIHLSIIKL